MTAHEEGQLLRVRGQYEAARDQFAACSSWTCPKVIAQDCSALLADLEAIRPSVVFQVHEPDGSPITDVRVLADGRLVTAQADGRPVTLDRGTHMLWFEAPGHQPLQHVLTVRDGEKNAIVRVELEPADPGVALDAQPSAARVQLEPSATRVEQRRVVIGYALGGSAVAALVTGVALGATGRREYERLGRRCASSPCASDDTARGKRLYIAADVAFGVAGGLALAATWLYVSQLLEKKSARLSGPRIDAQVERRGATLGWRTAF